MESISPERTYLSRTWRNSDRHKAGTHQSTSLDQEFVQPLGISQYRLAKAIDVPSAPTPICACAQAAHDKEVASTELAEEIERIQPLVGC